MHEAWLQLYHGIEMKIFDFLKKCATIIYNEKKDRESKYHLISHEENFEGSGHIYGKIRVKAAIPHRSPFFS